MPDERLRPYIKMYFWGNDNQAPLVQRIVPNGEIGLCFYRSGKVLYDHVGDRRSCLAGQSTHYQDIISDGNIEITGVHFTTLGAHLVFHSPLNIFFGQTVAIDDLEDKGLSELEDQIMTASTYLDCWRVMDSFFLNRIMEADVNVLNFKRLQRAIAYCQHCFNTVHICDMAEQACLSERHFNRVFSEVTGMSPKEYLRLQRYHKTLKNIKSGTDTISGIALKNGYCDFSHLAQDFKSISGYSPTELLKYSRNDNDEFGWRL